MTKKLDGGGSYRAEIYIDLLGDGYELMWLKFFADNDDKALERFKNICQALNEKYDTLGGVVVASRSELIRARTKEEVYAERAIEIPDDILEDFTDDEI